MTSSPEPLPWSQVAESDEVFSERTRKWYRVRSTSLLPTGMVRVRFEGVAKPFEKDADEKVPVRRGPTGKAVDIFITVMRSG